MTMIKWKTLEDLMALHRTFYMIYAVMCPEEYEEFHFKLHELHDRIYDEIRYVYRNYESVVRSEENDV